MGTLHSQASIDFLSAALSACGGFLSAETRSLIDSIAATGLKALVSLTSKSLFFCSEVKVALLNLACSCIITPWSDGARSELAEIVEGVAKKLETGGDINVASRAKAALRLCDSLSVPRAPPLLFVTRAVTANFSSGGSPKDLSATELSQDIQNARKESSRLERSTVRAKIEKAKEVLDEPPSKRSRKDFSQETKVADNEKEAEQGRPIKLTNESQENQLDRSVTVDLGRTEVKSQAEVMNHGNRSPDEAANSESKDHDGDPPKAAESQEGGSMPQVSNDNTITEETKRNVLDEDLAGNEEFPDIVMGGPDSDDE